ncbi:MAG: hypothetical protein ACKVVP_16435 [Chloroflexota bacterium]
MPVIRSSAQPAVIGIAVLSLVLAACGSQPTAAPSKPAAGVSASADKPAFSALVEKARQSNHVIRMGLEGTEPFIIKAKEEAFEKQFGFSLTLENEPGNTSRDIPVKIDKAAASGQGTVDLAVGGINTYIGTFRKGQFATPPWDALTQQWPLIAKLRQDVPQIGPNGNGAMLSDVCMHEGFASWVATYNTTNVKADDVKGIKWEDLAADRWKGRLALDSQALGLYVFPLAKGWSEDRLRIYAHNLGANGAKLISGGSAGVMQSIVQGEGDIGLVSATNVLQSIKSGAPVNMAFPEFLPMQFRVTCLTNPGVNDPSMAALFWAWNNFEGIYLEAQLTGGGALRFTPEEVDKLPLAARARDGGVTADGMVYPRSEAEEDATVKYRQIAIDGMNAGIRAGSKITAARLLETLIGFVSGSPGARL